MNDTTVSTIPLASPGQPSVQNGFVIPCNAGAGSLTCVAVADVAAVTVLRSHQDTGGWLVQVARRTPNGPHVIVAITDQRAAAAAIAVDLMAGIAAARRGDLAERVERLEAEMLASNSLQARRYEEQAS